MSVTNIYTHPTGTKLRTHFRSLIRRIQGQGNGPEPPREEVNRRPFGLTFSASPRLGLQSFLSAPSIVQISAPVFFCCCATAASDIGRWIGCDGDVVHILRKPERGSGGFRNML